MEETGFKECGETGEELCEGLSEAGDAGLISICKEGRTPFVGVTNSRV